MAVDVDLFDYCSHGFVWLLLDSFPFVDLVDWLCNAPLSIVCHFVDCFQL